jgi:hypothetical protein
LSGNLRTREALKAAAGGGRPRTELGSLSLSLALALYLALALALSLKADRSVVMRSPCAGAALDPPLWIVPNKALSLSLSQALSLAQALSGSLSPAKQHQVMLYLSCDSPWAGISKGKKNSIVAGGRRQRILE